MIFALLTLLAALALAAVAGWFSIVGFMAIYAGAPMYALIMGVVTECAKLVTTSWLYRNWPHTDWKLKGPLIYFTLALMTATSIGVFGFLSKAHLEQGAGTIDNSSRIEQLQYQVDREKATILDNEKVTKQLDDTVNSLLGKDRADRALSVRKSQANQRKQLRDDSAEAQKRIDALNADKFKLESEVRKQQLDVGPIRYIAELFYGATNDTNKNIETAVRIFTLLLVSTLDPLAVILLVAANHTLMRIKNEKEEEDKTPGDGFVAEVHETTPPDEEVSPRSEEVIGVYDIEQYDHKPIYEELIPTPRINDEEAALDAPIPQGSVEVLNEETQPATENDTQDDKFGADSDVVVAAIEESVPEVSRDDEEGTISAKIQEIPQIPLESEEVNEIEEDLVPEPQTASVQLPPTEHPQQVQETIPESPEEELSDEVIEKFTPIIVNMPVFGVKQPSPTKVSSVSPIVIELKPEEEVIPTLKPAPLPGLATLKAPWAHNETILREILGSSPHFIPQKVNEEEKSANIQESEADTSATPPGFPTAEEGVEEIHPESPSTDKEENEETGNRSEDTFWADSHKYPKALSWLAEFKRS